MYWRKIVNKWREEAVMTGKEFSTLPKHIFPSLLKQLMQHDYTKAIISGFEATGIFPTR